MKIRYLLASVLFLLSLQLHAQSVGELYRQSTKAYEAKDFPRFLQLALSLDSIRPSHPAFTYNLACAFALNNQPEKAFSVLRKVILMNDATAFETETDLASLKDSPQYAALLELKSDLGATISKSEKAVTLDEKDLHPEGFCYLKKSKTWLCSSIRKRKIVSFDFETGKCSDWFTGDIFAVFAIKPDAAEKYLWVATSAVPEMEKYSKEQEGKAEILKIDMQTNKITARFSVEGSHVFGDLIVGKNDEVYVSDSAQPVIYRISDDKISEWKRFDGIYNLQGLAFNAVGDKIYIADYFRGIAAVDLANPEVSKWLVFPENATVKGIDGLVCHDNILICIHNGVKPIRVMRYVLDNNDNIRFADAIDHNKAEFNEPALAVLKDNVLYFFANAPWTAYDKNGQLDFSKFGNPQLYRYKL